MSFPLQTLLDLRRKAEEQAEQALAESLSVCARVEAEQRALAECAAAARARAEAARGSDETATVGERLAAERFRERLMDEARSADQAALTHRKGSLAAARTEEAAARERHAAARRDRQAAEQVSLREEAEQRRVQERRAEDAISDLTGARRRGK